MAGANYGIIGVHLGRQKDSALADAVRAFYVDCGAKFVSYQYEPVPVHHFSKAMAPFPLGVGFSPCKSGWIFLFDSERFTLNWGLARALADRHGFQVLAIQRLDVCGLSCERWFGAKEAAPAAQAVTHPFAAKHYDRILDDGWEFEQCSFLAFDNVSPAAYSGFPEGVDHRQEVVRAHQEERAAAARQIAEQQAALDEQQAALDQGMLEKKLLYLRDWITVLTARAHTTFAEGELREIQRALIHADDGLIAGMALSGPELRAMAPNLLVLVNQALGELPPSSVAGLVELDDDARMMAKLRLLWAERTLAP